MLERMLDRRRYAPTLGRRVIHCEVPGCGRIGANGKPRCVEHHAELPAAARLYRIFRQLRKDAEAIAGGEALPPGSPFHVFAREVGERDFGRVEAEIALVSGADLPAVRAALRAAIEAGRECSE